MAKDGPDRSKAARQEAPVGRGEELLPGTVFFDAECSLCQACVAFLRRRDRAGRLRYQPLESDEGRRASEAAKVDPEGPGSLVFVDADGCLKESAAVLHTLGWLGPGWRLLARLGRPVPRRAADAIYRWVAARRRRRSEAATR